MEFVVQFLLYAIGAYVAYIIADRVKTRNPGINVEPIAYSVGSTLIPGFLVLTLSAII